MYHYQHNVMGERADCGKMAVRHLVFIYIYVESTEAQQ